MGNLILLLDGQHSTKMHACVTNRSCPCFGIILLVQRFVYEKSCCKFLSALLSTALGFRVSNKCMAFLNYYIFELLYDY